MKINLQCTAGMEDEAGDPKAVSEDDCRIWERIRTDWNIKHHDGIEITANDEDGIWSTYYNTEWAAMVQMLIRTILPGPPVNKELYLILHGYLPLAADGKHHENEPFVFDIPDELAKLLLSKRAELCAADGDYSPEP